MSNTNELINETSPYLLQHAHNPVNWYPWGNKAFSKATKEDKPIFLSIGYSTCHWCHVMAHESFEDAKVAENLNHNFVCIKVDREERPDVDSVYMQACQAMTGSGGWPTSIFMFADGKPFFAGTYFPKDAFLGLLDAVDMAWKNNRSALLESCERITEAIRPLEHSEYGYSNAPIEKATETFRRIFDKEYGGFGSAPKFPSPHNLMFLLQVSPEMAEKTLLQMYLGGIFDHIGGGFSRYSTDRYWLAPHFEKMLYDNALLAIAYLMAYEATGKELYNSVIERIFSYLEREMHSESGGFFSAQDADSEGEEGKYYIFTKDELIKLLGNEDGKLFCEYFGITEKGNFEGKNIPNLLHSPQTNDKIQQLIPKVYKYRKSRTSLHIDTKILTSWNALLAAAYGMAARILKNQSYKNTAKDILNFIETKLTEQTAVYTGISSGKRLGLGFLDDYAFYIFALIEMHQATQEEKYLARALELTKKTISDFWSGEHGGFFFSGENNEALIFRPKESWDGAVPSGNSVMMYNLLRLSMLAENEEFNEYAKKQQLFMNSQASNYPSGYSFYLYSVLPITKVVCNLKNISDLDNISIKSDWAFRITNSENYPIVNDKTTFYVCKNGTCLPPSNETP